VRSPAAEPSAKVKRIVSQYHASRRAVSMLWIDSVRSLAYQPAKTIARTMEKTTVVVTRETTRRAPMM
jgi:hypothetical protein